jgi:glutaconate CoA-transferase subunit B
MTAITAEYTTNELMVVAVARLLRDNEMGFLGIGTGGRAFTLTFGIPAAAAIGEALGSSEARVGSQNT